MFSKSLTFLCLVAAASAQNETATMTATWWNGTADSNMTMTDVMDTPDMVPDAVVPDAATPEMMTPEMMTPEMSPEANNTPMATPMMKTPEEAMTPEFNGTTPEDMVMKYICAPLGGLTPEAKALELKKQLTASFGSMIGVEPASGYKCSGAAMVALEVSLPQSSAGDFDACIEESTTCEVNNFPSDLSAAAKSEDSDSDFPIWAIIVIVVGALLLIGGIIYAVVRSRQSPSFGMSFPEQCGVLDEMEMEHEYKADQKPLN